MTEAEEKWAQPDTIVWATTGAISNQKIMPKPGGGLTQGHADLMQFAITSILFEPTRGVGGRSETGIKKPDQAVNRRPWWTLSTPIDSFNARKSP
jgi:hypothetical protein